jgi:methionyl-tRNA formyltransferase
MVEAVDLVAAGKAPRVPQDESRATYDPLCTDAHAAVRWASPLHEVYDRIRGCDPQPGAHGRWRGEMLRLYDARRAADVAAPADADPGTVLALDDLGLLVVAGTGAERGVLRIGRLRGSGAKAKAAEIASAAGIAAGSRLGDGVA